MFFGWATLFCAFVFSCGGALVFVSWCDLLVVLFCRLSGGFWSGLDCGVFFDLVDLRGWLGLVFCD